MRLYESNTVNENLIILNTRFNYHYQTLIPWIATACNNRALSIITVEHLVACLQYSQMLSGSRKALTAVTKLALKKIRSVCFRCHAPAPYRCSRCHSVKYCSRECQRLAWKSDHKRECVQMNVFSLKSLFSNLSFRIEGSNTRSNLSQFLNAPGPMVFRRVAPLKSNEVRPLQPISKYQNPIVTHIILGKSVAEHS